MRGFGDGWVQQIVALFSALLTPTIGIITTYIAVQQYRANKIRLRLERYSRRIEIYAELKKMLSIILRDADISTEELLRFRTSTAESDFLFGKEVPEYIDEVYKAGLKLWQTNAELREADLSGTQRAKKVDENHRILTCLTEQLPLLRGKFKKYLNLSG